MSSDENSGQPVRGGFVKEGGFKEEPKTAKPDVKPVGEQTPQKPTNTSSPENTGQPGSGDDAKK